MIGDILDNTYSSRLTLHSHLHMNDCSSPYVQVQRLYVFLHISEI